jgi:beta-glucosidase
MGDKKISRRAVMMGAGVAAAWVASPARQLAQAAAAGPVPAFIDTLISRMSLEEKAGQLQLMAAAWSGGIATAINPPSGNSGNFDQQVEAAVAGRLTGVFNGNGAVMAERMQRAVMKKSRMKIPLIFAADIIHGHRTIFPVGVGEAASFEPSLAERTARVAAIEAAAAGIDWTFAPMVDIARDQRWGRTMEGAGEDVLLGCLFAVARVKGFQGSDLRADDAMMACIKHIAAYGAAMGGLDYNTVDISERTLREVYLPPYQAGFDAGALSGMAAFNEINGIPAHGNKWLMTDLLRDEWKFQGIVVSDYTGDEEMIAHGYAKDGRDAARLAILAGVDMSMQSDLYARHLPGLVRDGLVPEAVVDRSVRRVLAVKAMLGLFDDPFRRIDAKREKARTRLPAHLALAREAGRKSIVLLKNDGNLLPLPKQGSKIAFIGPFLRQERSLNGPWVIYGDNAQAVDLPTGVRAALGPNAAVSFTDGSGVDTPLPGGIDAAITAANAADIVVLCVGESERMSGEAQSRTDIVLPAAQQELAEALAATGKPMVVLLTNGRALALKGAVRNANAILVTWFLGSEAGHAMADILFGDHGPSGRLPCSFPYETGQQPYFYAHKNTGRPMLAGKPTEYKAKYREVPNAALYPFGHGLTYGDIRYSDLKLPGTLAWDGTLTVSATITNRGSRAAEEVAQLYIRDQTASITRPVRELKAFAKLPLAPGESRVATFTLTRQDLLFYGVENKPTVEPGLFTLWIAPSAQAEGVTGVFELIG